MTVNWCSWNWYVTNVSHQIITNVIRKQNVYVIANVIDATIKPLKQLKLQKMETPTTKILINNNTINKHKIMWMNELIVGQTETDLFILYNNLEPELLSNKWYLMEIENMKKDMIQWVIFHSF